VTRLRVAATIGVMVGALCVLSAAVLSPAAADQTASKVVTCEERLPKGAKRPVIREKFPGEGIAGFEAQLLLEIRHGKGETPLSTGFKIVSGSSTAKHLEEAGFLVAEVDGGSNATVVTEDDGDAAVTRVTIPFVLAPNKPGEHSLTLPQVPLSISRANGDTMTVCTHLHLVTVHDPTADTNDAELKPRPNPPARAQIEDWPLIKWLLAGLIALLVIAILTAWWVRNQMRKPVPDAAALKRLPWEEALAELEALKGSPLFDPAPEAGPRRTELFDKISDSLRKYLGARYGFEGLGFDGLETTTGEMMTLLKRVRPAIPNLDVVQLFLSECDLVKFARVVPEIPDCSQALGRAETVVRATIPLPPGVQPGPPGGAPATAAFAAAPAPDAPAPIAEAPSPYAPPASYVPPSLAAALLAHPAQPDAASATLVEPTKPDAGTATAANTLVGVAPIDEQPTDPGEAPPASSPSAPRSGDSS